MESWLLALIHPLPSERLSCTELVENIKTELPDFPHLNTTPHLTLGLQSSPAKWIKDELEYMMDKGLSFTYVHGETEENALRKKMYAVLPQKDEPVPNPSTAQRVAYGAMTVGRLRLLLEVRTYLRSEC